MVSTVPIRNCIQAYYDAHQIRTPIRSIHRLDYETSGLVFYCKMPFFQGHFDEQLKQKKIERIYLAWVLGQITAPLTITKAIGRDRHDAKKMRVSNRDVGAYRSDPTITKGQHHFGKMLIENRKNSSDSRTSCGCSSSDSFRSPVWQS